MIMKRKLALLFILIFILSGCNKINDTKNNVEENVINVLTINSDISPNKVDSSNSINSMSDSNSSSSDIEISSKSDILNKIKQNIIIAHTPDSTQAPQLLIEESVLLLKEYLSSTPENSVELDFLKSIEGFRVFNKPNSLLIEYSKPYTVFGEANFSSWQVFKYYPYDFTTVIESDQRLFVHDYSIINTNGFPRLFTYNRNHPLRSEEIVIKAYKIEKNKSTEIQSVVPKVNFKSLWSADDDGIIRTNIKMMHKYVDFISEDSKIVRIKGTLDDKIYDLELRLNKDGYYELYK